MIAHAAIFIHCIWSVNFDIYKQIDSLNLNDPVLFDIVKNVIKVKALDFSGSSWSIEDIWEILRFAWDTAKYLCIEMIENWDGNGCVPVENVGKNLVRDRPKLFVQIYHSISKGSSNMG